MLAGAAFGLLLGAALVALVATRFFGFALLAVNSDSMAPAIESGDAIVVKPVSADSIGAGDVILFQSGGDLVPTVHRVIGVHEIEARVTSRASGETAVSKDYRFVTQGDGNPAPDAATVPAERVLGEVWFTVPQAGALFGIPAQALLFVAAGTFGVLWLGLEAMSRYRRARAAATATG
jgi:signal peptidase